MNVTKTPRSWLFVPGHSRRMMDKALGSGADVLILDLEDAVAPEAKADARATVAEFLQEVPTVPCYVRVNALTSGMTGADLKAIGSHAAGFVVPKCESTGDLDRFADHTGGAPVLAIAPETVRAVRALLTQDWSHPTLTGLAWGAEDLAADLGAVTKRGPDGRYLSPFAMARDAMLFAAKAAGVAAVDTVYVDTADTDGLLAEATASESIGFTAKMAIHPRQVPPIHAAFTPSPARVDWALKVVAALRDAGGGVAVVEGQMVDRPHLRQAEAILARGH
ncbi:hypothetical protein ATO6_10260 [Oceanicola sp. 22II-s10i]|uniref:HpcH/HpaI aldolase/citrate lyase family protein n=1 Tax=Oceanicola sp. 22II-s10i TaxID=1317116 RepID=UPI000B5264AD|nr:CoA ester lyase [Oceanicola sp. 22II-s10i]OWU84715.1 hypothetical protein ATO6_10260 [Oceanicola sp. 22II-s10i]